ncbi:hypothetical protein FB559_1543 [Actinoallomurus bryophytorum]|uniref:Uncharacterized protein n=2 Tax=Actinoallomurus bryophytorum TaxID=1490222 RepID=A0A543CG14_9ACTN|nr:hypothetical protein FB559_1543 [Actinoallomurus bryophytorum]
MVKLIVELDVLLGDKLLATLPMELTSATEEDLLAWRSEDFALLAEQFRELASRASLLRIERANSPLVRKVKGARDALEYSADGVSQAANSLIELIDRLMRERFERETVIEWIDANLPHDATLVYMDDKNQRRPTKRAEALCLVYGGGAVASLAPDVDGGATPSFIHDLLARAIVAARGDLQKLKHADGDLRDDREKLLVLLPAVEGALLLGLQLGLIADYTDTANEQALPETA